MSSFETVFDYDNKRKQVSEIEVRMAAPGFWDNQERAQAAVAQLKSLKAILAPAEELIRAVGDLDALLEMADEDESIAGEVVAEIERAEQRLDELELRALLNGPNDDHGAILTINARDGGTDANDWAEMLLRMYLQWAKRTTTTPSCSTATTTRRRESAAPRSPFAGPMAYGYLKGETGMHRLVRISPFNAEGKRQTSFAAVDVSPEVSDDIDIEIEEKDVREDVFRASGAGGQHVNKTTSAIRLTHLPTGIVVQCQNERSQHKNRATAWKMLRARLARVEEEKREAEQAAKYQKQARWALAPRSATISCIPTSGSRTRGPAFTVGNFHSVLDGNMQGFLDSYLRWRVQQDQAPAKVADRESD